MGRPRKIILPIAAPESVLGDPVLTDMVEVEGLVPDAHLGDGRVLMMGAREFVTADLAIALHDKRQAKYV